MILTVKKYPSHDRYNDKFAIYCAALPDTAEKG